jgi:hypothetical protein
MSDMKMIMELMNAFNQDGPGNQFSQTYNPAAQYGPRSSPMPAPDGVGAPTGMQTDSKLLQMLNPRAFQQADDPNNPTSISTFSQDGGVGSRDNPMFSSQSMKGGAN